MTTLRRLVPVLVITGCVSVVLSAVGGSFSPFIRSLVVCEDAANATQLLHTELPSWPGSRFCGNRDLVLSEAQHLDGKLTGFKLVCRALALPLLGSLADLIGRKRVYLFGVFGSATAFAVNGLVAFSGLSPNMLYLSFAIQGVTSVFGAITQAMVADLSDPKERGYYFTVTMLVSSMAGGVGSAANVYIQKLFLLDYTRVWAGFAGGMLLIGVFACGLFPETLPMSATSTPHTKESMAVSVVSGISKMLRDPFLRTMGFVTFLSVLGYGCLVVLGSYTMSVLNWRQGDVGMIMLTVFGPIAFLSLMSAPRICRVLGNGLTMMLSIGVAFLAQLALVASAVFGGSERWFYVALVLFCLSVFGMPASNAFVSHMYKKDDQAKVQSCIGVMVNVAGAIAIPFFSSSWMYDASDRGFSAAKPFLLGAFFLSLGGCAMVPAIRLSNQRTAEYEPVYQKNHELVPSLSEAFGASDDEDEEFGLNDNQLAWS